MKNKDLSYTKKLNVNFLSDFVNAEADLTLRCIYMYNVTICHTSGFDVLSCPWLDVMIA